VNRKYDREFRIHTAEPILKKGIPVTQLAKELGLRSRQVTEFIRKYIALSYPELRLEDKQYNC